MSQSAKRILGVLSDEIAAAQRDLDRWLATLKDAEDDDGALVDALESYANQVERLGGTCQLLGLPGLSECCNLLGVELLAIGTLDREARRRQCTRLASWPALFLDYLSAPGDFERALLIVGYLSSPVSAVPVEECEAQRIAELLARPIAVPAEFVESEASAGALIATAEDISLQPPVDGDPDVFQALLEEAPGKAAELASILHRVQLGEADTEALRHAKRLAHSLKGSANIAGIRGVATISHHAEDILEFLETHSGAIPTRLAGTLADAGDCLEQMIGSLAGLEAQPLDAKSVLQSIMDWSSQIKEELPQDASASVGLSPERFEAAAPTGLAAAGEAQQGLPAVVMPFAPNQSASDAGQSLRVPVQSVDELFRLVSEMTMKIGQLETRLRAASQRAKTMVQQNMAVQQRIFELENLVDIRGVALMKSNPASIEGGPLRFDPLELDQYSELHSAARVLTEVTADFRELGLSLSDDLAQFGGDLLQQSRINKDLQHVIMSTRMTPLSSIVPRLRRNVKQTCAATGKRAELEVTGEEILVDGEILNKLADPLLHILRNAVDHGIEPPAERLQTGKPEVGRIELRVARHGPTVVIEVCDDGKGLDYHAIRTKAIARSLIRPEQQPSEPELARLTLMPGFSTREDVTEISGRGVGMDVVRDRLQAMKGSVELHSRSGAGLTVRLRFQASLIQQHALLVSVDEQLFAIPSHMIAQALLPGVGEFIAVGDTFAFLLGSASLRVHYLRDLLGVPGNTPSVQEMSAMIALQLSHDGETFVLLVDRAVDSRDLIVKAVGRRLARVRGVSGVTILGDGVVVPLLDVGELLSTPRQALGTPGATVQETGMPKEDAAPAILVVDDSLSVRKSLSNLMKDAGYRVRAAKDGFEAIRLMDEFQPQVVLTDLEMPNMNGLEFTAHLRAHRQTESLPVIMITSRSMEKHRKMAGEAGVDIYLTKPYADHELLSQIESAIAGKRHVAASPSA